MLTFLQLVLNLDEIKALPQRKPFPMNRQQLDTSLRVARHPDRSSGEIRTGSGLTSQAGLQNGFLPKACVKRE